MKLQFTKKVVRETLAGEVRKASWLGVAVATAWGIAGKNAAVLFGALWWIICQFASMFLLALPDEKPEDKRD